MAERAVARLASLGHRRIVFGTTRREVNQAHIFEHACRAAMRAHELRCDPALVVRVPDAPEGGCDFVSALLGMADRPAAVVLLQETMAIGLYRRLRDAGLRPGHSLAVVSYGAFAVADPRPNLDRVKGDAWHGGGHFGVVPWDATSGAVSAAAGCDKEAWSVADPRLPGPAGRLVAVIRALDGTFHRPFSTLELGALQSLVDPEEHLELEGLSDAAWRERIGNAVPPDAAQAMAETMGCTLLMAWNGTGFMLSNLPIWVRPVAVALSVRQPDELPGGLFG